jgi:hypothetical protein
VDDLLKIISVGIRCYFPAILLGESMHCAPSSELRLTAAVRRASPSGSLQVQPMSSNDEIVSMRDTQ